MDEDLEKRIDYLHMVLGAVAGYVSGALVVNGGLIGLLIGYSGYFITKAALPVIKEEYTLNKWVSKGFMSFIMIWLPMWIFFYNI